MNGRIDPVSMATFNARLWQHFGQSFFAFCTIFLSLHKTSVCDRVALRSNNNVARANVSECFHGNRHNDRRRIVRAFEKFDFPNDIRSAWMQSDRTDLSAV